MKRWWLVLVLWSASCGVFTAPRVVDTPSIGPPTTSGPASPISVHQPNASGTVAIAKSAEYGAGDPWPGRLGAGINPLMIGVVAAWGCYLIWKPNDSK